MLALGGLHTTQLRTRPSGQEAQVAGSWALWLDPPVLGLPFPPGPCVPIYTSL